jgi:hypothetical protein
VQGFDLLRTNLGAWPSSAVQSWTMRVHVDGDLTDQTFILEEVIFIRCRLKNCDLFYSGGDYEWLDTHFENCRFHWRGPAKNTFAILQGFGLLTKPPSGQAAIPPTAGKPN